jgi:hypothetical protein
VCMRVRAYSLAYPASNSYAPYFNVSMYFTKYCLGTLYFSVQKLVSLTVPGVDARAPACACECVGLLI